MDLYLKSSVVVEPEPAGARLFGWSQGKYLGNEDVIMEAL